VTDALPDPDAFDVRAVLLASEEREISPAAVQLAARMARRCRAPVHVFSIARVWGTTFGFPNPGLNPTKGEWDTQRRNVDKAVKALRRKGIDADGRVVGTRAAAKRIVREARRLECDAIVMGADPPRGRLLADFIWSQEPYRVRRRADVPVYLVQSS
jgi:nucleotide-binding universal stress UspA family protein